MKFADQREKNQIFYASMVYDILLYVSKPAWYWMGEGKKDTKYSVGEKKVNNLNNYSIYLILRIQSIKITVVERVMRINIFISTSIC